MRKLKIKLTICNHQADCPFQLRPEVWFGYCPNRKVYGYTWHRMSLLRPGAIKQYKVLFHCCIHVSCLRPQITIKVKILNIFTMALTVHTFTFKSSRKSLYCSSVLENATLLSSPSSPKVWSDSPLIMFLVQVPNLLLHLVISLRLFLFKISSFKLHSTYKSLHFISFPAPEKGRPFYQLPRLYVTIS